MSNNLISALKRVKEYIEITEMLPAHWEAVKVIYEKGIATGNATFQTAAPSSWELWDKAHTLHSRFVALLKKDVVGWIALSPISARECYIGVCELSVYVDPEYGGRGIGKCLMEAVVSSSEAKGVWTLYSSTFPENIASLALQKSFGFREIGYRERIAQLDGIWRNTLLLERRSNVVG